MDVSEVLTLLDTIDSNENDSRSVISLEFESEFGHDAVPNVSPQQPQLKSKKDRRRKEGPVRYTTNLQRRKKAELKALREEARQLNAQLEGLLLSRLSHIGMVPAITPQDQNPGVWRSLAIIESEGRERAERANRELKSIVANQVKVHASIRKILGRNDLLQGMDFVFEAQPTSDRLLQQFDFSDAILAELSSGLGRLRLQANNVLPALKVNPSITCSSQNKQLSSGGNCIETTSITPIACPMQKAAEIMWHQITTKENRDTQKSFRFVRTRNPNSVERNCMASLPDGKSLLVNLDGVNIIRMYEEENQVVFVGSTTWLLQTGGLQFEDHHWTIISPSPSNPLHASVAKAEAMKQQRLEAELLNMTLRRTLAKEQKVAKSLRTIMDKRPFMPRSVKYDMRRASCSQTETRTQISQCTQCCNPTTSHINPTGVRREIEATLQRMHVQTNALLNATAADDSLSFNFNIRLDPAAGPTIEVRYQSIFMVHAAFRLDAMVEMRTSSNSLSSWELHTRLCFLTVWALCFRACTWLAVRQPPSDPVNESVIRSHYSVAAEKAVGCTVIDGEHIDSVRDRALRAMGKQIKERYLAMQRRILLQTGRGDLVHVHVHRNGSRRRLMTRAKTLWSGSRSRRSEKLDFEVNALTHAFFSSNIPWALHPACCFIWTMHCDYEIPVIMSELMELLEDIKNYQHDEILGTPSESTYASATTARTETADSESVSLKTREHSSSRPRRKRIRKVGSVPYSTDLQRRRKAEVLSLRSEVQELECKLSQLQQQSNGGETAISTRQSQAEWQNRAWIVRQEREKAESANRELKNILSKRFSFIASMQTLLQRSDLLEGIDILSQNSMQLLTQPDSVFPALDSCLAVALITHKKRHELQNPGCSSGSSSSTGRTRNQISSTDSSEQATTPPLK
ncbi:hypothetical protein PC118_g8895 [Phytophthora cactorum]|uniref:Uncharacterized protein n=2 Tax=Phytophthora cactorum TaxID=29920 RepID=A0A8T1G755_9STRA|nr:hypothetical protein PC118_g8895 [Phytophthora cactorum]